MPPLDECPPNTRRVGTCYPPYYKCNLGVCIPIVPNGYGVCCKGRKLIYHTFYVKYFLINLFWSWNLKKSVICSFYFSPPHIFIYLFISKSHFKNMMDMFLRWNKMFTYKYFWLNCTKLLSYIIPDCIGYCIFGVTLYTCIVNYLKNYLTISFQVDSTEAYAICWLFLKLIN